MRSQTLGELTAGFTAAKLNGDPYTPITGIAYDSRRVEPGFLFVCIQGFRDDGHRYVPQALARGASALVIERGVDLPRPVPVVHVPSGRQALAWLSDRFYGQPSRSLTLIGITGTQGKTTTAYLVDAILRQAGVESGMIGTVLTRIGEEERRSVLTTPESLDLQELLRAAVHKGLSHVVMEVSSHALTLHRVACCHFDVAVFTNLTSDHLDLHGSVDGYLRAKARLFAELPPDRLAVVNRDDLHGAYILAITKGRRTTYGLTSEADISAAEIEGRLGETHFRTHTPVGEMKTRLRLTGVVNVHNALAATGVGLGLGVDLETIRRGLESLSGIPGRFELISEGQDFLVIVDFAHTGAALDRLLGTVRDLTSGRVIMVLGCPGDRDRSQRPTIGELTCRQSDFAVITSDNPASEDPEAIAGEIQAGAQRVDPEGRRHRIILDRTEAIAYALDLARSGDAVILAGKGHEEYQIMKGGLVPFSDREVARALLREQRR